MLFFAPSSASLKFMMKPSSLRMRAISVLSFDAGTSTLGWRANCALRIRVSMSEIGSDVDIALTCEILSSPASLDHAGDLAGQGELSEANPAQIEFADITSRPAATETAVAKPDLYARRAVLGRHLGFGLGFFRDLGCSCHPYSSSIA